MLLQMAEFHSYLWLSRHWHFWRTQLCPYIPLLPLKKKFNGNIPYFMLVVSSWLSQGSFAVSGQISGFILCKRTIYWNVSIRELFINIDMWGKQIRFLEESWEVEMVGVLSRLSLRVPFSWQLVLLCTHLSVYLSIQFACFFTYFYVITLKKWKDILEFYL